MNEIEKEELGQLLNKLKITTESYVDHSVLTKDFEKYLLIIAIEKYLERYE